MDIIRFHREVIFGQRIREVIDRLIIENRLAASIFLFIYLLYFWCIGAIIGIVLNHVVIACTFVKETLIYLFSTVTRDNIENTYLKQVNSTNDGKYHRL